VNLRWLRNRELCSLPLSSTLYFLSVAHEHAQLNSRCLLDRLVTLQLLLLLPHKTVSPSPKHSLVQQPLSTRFQAMQVLNKLHLLLPRPVERLHSSESSLLLLLIHHPPLLPLPQQPRRTTLLSYRRIVQQVLEQQAERDRVRGNHLRRGKV